MGYLPYQLVQDLFHQQYVKFRGYHISFKSFLYIFSPVVKSMRIFGSWFFCLDVSVLKVPEVHGGLEQTFWVFYPSSHKTWKWKMGPSNIRFLQIWGNFPFPWLWERGYPRIPQETNSQSQFTPENQWLVQMIFSVADQVFAAIWRDDDAKKNIHWKSKSTIFCIFFRKDNCFV